MGGLGIKILITEEQNDKLLEFRYGFEYDERKHLLWCRSYMKVERPSKRHNFSATEIFGSMDKRHDTLEKLPNVPERVYEEARSEFVDYLKVKVE